VFRYEDLAADNKAFLAKLLKYLDVAMPEPELEALADKYAFEKLAGDRPQGQEDIQSHYRKGIAGDWKNCFDEANLEQFRQATGDLLETLGYA